MIELTRLNGEQMVVNSDLIRYAEASPDTVITLVTGDKLVVAESTQELIERVVTFRSLLLQRAFPDGMAAVDPSQMAASLAATAAHATTAALPPANLRMGQDESWRRRGRETD